MTIPSISELDLPDDELLRRIVTAVAAHPEVREPLLRVLLTDEFLNLPTEVKELREEMREGFRAVNERIDENTRSIRTLTGQMGELRGEAYERRCAEQIDAALMHHFDFAALADRTSINRQLVQARRSGLLTREEYEAGRNIDIIAQEQMEGETPSRLAVIEVSITFNADDLKNAAERAATIARITGVPTAAFLITRNTWPESVAALAEQSGVTIIRRL